MNIRALAFEAACQIRWHGWERLLRRNRWFQNHASKALKQLRQRMPESQVVVFGYSYAARDLFRFAKDAGWTTVLGQIDPGPFEEKLVLELYSRNGAAGHSGPAPAEYWEQWREECKLADHIIVNSQWSFRGLCDEGIPAGKLRVVPLAYDPPAAAAGFTRRYPNQFDSRRSLRVLFLGQVNLRKGVGEILAAISKLEGLPVEFWMVGPVQIPVPSQFKTHPQVRWLGAVPRSSVAAFYKEADIFLFPTFSDGFGLTQLEAQAWKLPVIASHFCGDVVRDGRNGLLLEELSGESIAQAIRTLLLVPGEIQKMSAASGIEKQFTLSSLAERLMPLAGIGN